jgi:hypothetical protein
MEPKTLIIVSTKAIYFLTTPVNQPAHVIPVDFIL